MDVTIEEFTFHSHCTEFVQQCFSAYNIECFFKVNKAGEETLFTIFDTFFDICMRREEVVSCLRATCFCKTLILIDKMCTVNNKCINIMYILYYYMSYLIMSYLSKDSFYRPFGVHLRGRRVPGDQTSKLSWCAFFILGNKSYQLVFTRSKNIVPSQSYGPSKLSSRL